MKLSVNLGDLWIFLYYVIWYIVWKTLTTWWLKIYRFLDIKVKSFHDIHEMGIKIYNLVYNMV